MGSADGRVMACTPTDASFHDIGATITDNVTATRCRGQANILHTSRSHSWDRNAQSLKLHLVTV